jgi:hypothetical protein
MFAITQLKAHWPFVALPARVAVHAQLHLIIVAQNRFEMPSANGIPEACPPALRKLDSRRPLPKRLPRLLLSLAAKSSVPATMLSRGKPLT